MNPIGAGLQDLETPVLLVDQSALQRNIERMAAFFRGDGKTPPPRAQLRPHFKNNKCTQIARRQIAAGAIGMTCAKVTEAEALADAGIKDILIANQIVGERKVERLLALAARTQLRVAIDDIAQAQPISTAASRAGVTVGLLIEVNIGMGRCGLAPGEPVLELAKKLAKLPGVRFDGLQAYEGHLVDIVDPQERRQKVLDDFAKAVRTRRMIESAGIPVAVISGGSSSTYDITGKIDGIDEIQAGTYVTMDWQYKLLRPEFENALTVATRIISKPSPDMAVADIGLKGMATEFGIPQVKGNPKAVIPSYRSEEHCVIRGETGWKIGDAIELIPSHACTTCNLYREMLVHENGRVVDVWPIEASGRPS